MSNKLIDKTTTVQASRSFRSNGATSFRVDTSFRQIGVTDVSALIVAFQGSSTNDGNDNWVIQNPTLAVGSTAEMFANAAFDYLIAGVTYTKAVNAAGTAFSAAHVVTGSKFGVVKIYINATGTWLTEVPAATQAYATAALAIAAMDAMALPAPAYIPVGYILIEADSSTWTANTDNLTDVSEVTSATFESNTSSFITINEHTLSGAEITARRGVVHLADKVADFVRTYVSTITGSAEVTVRYTPNKRM